MKTTVLNPVAVLGSFALRLGLCLCMILLASGIRAETGGNVLIDWSDDATPMNAIVVGKSALVPLFQCTLFGVIPHYLPQTQQFTLTATGWTLKGRIGSKQYLLNGKPRQFSLPPRLAPLKPIGSDLPAPHIPYLPLTDIARLRKFMVHMDNSSHGLRYVQIQSPPPHAYQSDMQPDMQSVANPKSQQQGNLIVSAPGLDIDLQGCFVSVKVTNRGKKPYYLDKRFLFLEMLNGTIISGDDIGGSEGGNPPYLVQPGETYSLNTDPLLFPLLLGKEQSLRAPLKAIHYADGVHAFTWKMEY